MQEEANGLKEKINKRIVVNKPKRRKIGCGYNA